jgi:alanine dehydrogenase
VLVLSDDFVRENVSIRESIDWVESAFAASARGDAETFPAVVERLPRLGAMFGIKSGALFIETERPVLGLKAGGYWPANARPGGPPAHRAVMLLFEAATGEPLALLAANVLTSLRTGAAGGVAARHLARTDASVAGVIGAGEQARAQLEALRCVRPLREARVWARRAEAARAFASEWEGRGLSCRVAPDPRSAVEGADVIVTATPSTEPLVRSDWIGPGVHVNAVGSDTPGKQELEASLLARSTLVVDRIAQSATIGELQHAIREGLLTAGGVHAELGQVCTGLAPGRRSDAEITVFDSTGVSFQDLVLAGHVCRRAREQGCGTTVAL